MNDFAKQEHEDRAGIKTVLVTLAIFAALALLGGLLSGQWFGA